MKVGDKVRIGSDFIDAGEVGEIVEINGPWIYVEKFGVYHREDLELVKSCNPALKVGDKVRILDEWALNLNEVVEKGDVIEILHIDPTYGYFFKAEGEHWILPNSPIGAWEIVEETNQWDFLEDTMEYEVPKTVLTPRGKKTEWVKREEAMIPYTVDMSSEFATTITLPGGSYVVTLPPENTHVITLPHNAGISTVEGGANKSSKEYEMTTEEYFEFIDKVCEEMKELVRAKNADYTSGVSPFANFKASARFGVDPLVGLSVRVGDKIQRLQSYCSKGELQVKGEGIKDVFKDLIGYSWLALGMLEEKERNN